LHDFYQHEHQMIEVQFEEWFVYDST